MKSKWKVSSNNIAGETQYIAYRLIDINNVDHSGNREYAGEYTINREAAAILAEQLNKEESNESTK